MPLFRIGRSVSWVAGSTETEVIECDSLEQAQQWAEQAALDKLDHWAEPVEDDEKEEE